MKIIHHYFPDLTLLQQDRFSRLQELYQVWNSRINVISRKDIGNLFIHHVLFSLGIAKIFNFEPGTKIMDAGTGGGFPGIPLAIYFPEVEFRLVDSIAKKIKVVKAICDDLGLRNVNPVCDRFENVPGQFDFITGRAVKSLSGIIPLVRFKLSGRHLHPFPNGIIYLKGGDFYEELEVLNAEYAIYPLSEFFRESFFKTKKVVHIYNFIKSY